MIALLLPAPIVGVIAGAAMLGATAFWGGLLLPLALIKLLFLKVKPVQIACRRVGIWVAFNWASTIQLVTQLLHAPEGWDISRRGALDPRKNYLLISNHQSWADIPMLFVLLHRRVPFLRFFIKQQLLYMPIIGSGCWVMDFPFMKRYPREAVEANPALRKEDLETTRRACEIYKAEPVTVVNFPEGTRFTEEKRVARQSPFRNLLRPKSAGLSFTLDAMGEQFAGIIDVTLVYRPTPKPLLWSWLCGEQNQLAARVEVLPIPAEIMHGHYDSDPEFRERFQAWVNALWAKKDAQIERMRHRQPLSSPSPLSPWGRG